MIQPTSNYLGHNRADALAGTATKTSVTTPPVAVGDSLSRSNTEALKAALSASPEIRPDVVARGQRLLVDLNYPPRAIIEGLSKLFTDSTDLSEIV